ncbi:enoyl-CoA hydratase/isomerase family protein [Leptospira fainei serovar Hurstbridge str. BUT 6]|uniref:Enoyl-CoA hydratase/isomerase family protein n=1 Tax=Leptospira fainei serovar Hurstbridge str. BUT 6 TaxID=1193011 RepID=S3VYH6_9LEPT|nr:enoyl-CoA hydratase-related protein [Leptospira fainei]EPG73177.1 enoyl-CoA hydratase/isomerase family protein [Leptospira fainei serovar Hurstbridge str. BUT 6]
MSQIVLYSIRENIATITLNRPEKRNAISRELLQSFMSLIEKTAQEPNIRVLIIRAEGPVFCAGADLKERETMSEEEVHSFLDTVGSCFRLLEKLPFPTIAALDGDAFGGGLELALSCDFILLKEGVKVGLTETGLGIIPGAGGTQRLPRRIGFSKAMEMILTAKILDSKSAFDCGLANLIASTSAYEEANVLAATISEKGPVAVRLAKAAIRDGEGLKIEDALKIERMHYNKTLATEDRKEALLAFKEKRKPQFKGK